MPVEEPSWWYRAPGADWRQRLLRPLAWVYGSAVIRRFHRRVPVRPTLPVICVGNFTAGGTGKTPLTLLIARMVAEHDGQPAILSRGYGGTERGPLLVDPEHSSPDGVGDEPLLLARHAVTLVCRDRAKGAQALEHLEPQPSVIIMDDGLQNPSLVKDLAIAVVDGRRGLGNGDVIPAGPLRAPLGFQLGLVQALVVNLPGPPEARHPERSRMVEAMARLIAGPVLAAWPVPADDADKFKQAKVVAYAGIGDPQRFFDLLRSLGAEIAAAVPFKDHHRFTSEDAGRLLALAAHHGARLVTTEKDLARLAGQSGQVGMLREKSEVLAIRLEFADQDRDRLTRLVLTAAGLPA